MGRFEFVGIRIQPEPDREQLRLGCRGLLERGQQSTGGPGAQGRADDHGLAGRVSKEGFFDNVALDASPAAAAATPEPATLFSGIAGLGLTALLRRPFRKPAA